jgi:catechol 2,3-dioxygenase-like lactoylglutathione lyase family enzyme
LWKPTGGCCKKQNKTDSVIIAMEKRYINGIQQVGIGVTDAGAAFDWYRKVFGMDILVFKDTATASLMKQYTGNTAYQRHAFLAMNLQGGGGFELWQYATRQPATAATQPVLGDLGIFAVKIKCRSIDAAHTFFQSAGMQLVTAVTNHPFGYAHFFVQDTYGNFFEVLESGDSFSYTKHVSAGVSGVLIGVSDMERSVAFYKNVLGFSKVLYSDEGRFDDWAAVTGGGQYYKRVLLGRSEKPTGAFGALLGSTTIELVQATKRQPVKMYENRYWGDPGFIHVCFDINGMEAHETICWAAGYPLTVNSRNSFDMGKAAGHFAYNEDPDGTLIEYVETHKVPIIKKLGLYLNLKKRNPEKQLPRWVVQCLRFSRVK